MFNALNDDSNSESANKTEPELEQDTETEVAALATMLGD